MWVKETKNARNFATNFGKIWQTFCKIDCKARHENKHELLSAGNKGTFLRLMLAKTLPNLRDWEVCMCECWPHFRGLLSMKGKPVRFLSEKKLKTEFQMPTRAVYQFILNFISCGMKESVFLGLLVLRALLERLTICSLGYSVLVGLPILFLNFANIRS